MPEHQGTSKRTGRLARSFDALRENMGLCGISARYVEAFAEENGGAVETVLFPYEETEPGSRQFGLTRFDEAYWDHFRRQMEHLA